MKIEKVLITGITGFVGSHLADYILENHPEVKILGLIRWRSPKDNIKHIVDKITLLCGDLADPYSLRHILLEHGPDVIFHLAAQSYVPYSFKVPIATLNTNVIGTANLLEEIKQLKFYSGYDPIVHVCSSSEVYGQVREDEVPIKETNQFRPASPYCLPPDSKILLENGREIDIEKINKEMNIISLENNNRTEIGNFSYFFLDKNKLINKHPNNISKKHYTGNLVEIKSDHDTLLCTPEHRILIKRPKRFKSGNLDHSQMFNYLPIMEVPAANIKIGDWLLRPRKVSFNGKETYGKKFWRFLGYFMGDGNVSINKHGYYNIKLADDKKELLEKYDKIIQEITYDKVAAEAYDEIINILIDEDIEITEDFIKMFSEEKGLNFYRVKHWFKDRSPIVCAKPSYWKHKTKDCWYLSFGHKIIAEIIYSLGMNVNANLKRVPDILFDSTDGEIAEFIAGYFDADGTMANGDSIKFDSSSRRLIYDVKLLLRRFGIITSAIYKYIDADGHIIYTITISENSSKQLFLDNINIFKKSKLSIGKTQENVYHENIYHSVIKEIRYIKSKHDNVYDMEIEDTHNFVANGFLVHNSVSKVGEDMLALQYWLSWKIKTIRTRMFTHTGPRRGEVFATSTFAKQIAAIEAGKQPPIVKVGNLDSIRTFLDVKDAVRAYWILVNKCTPGDVYNIGGIETMTVGDMLNKLLKLSTRRDIKIEVDPNRLRPSDVTLQIPSIEKFTKETSWKPEIPFDNTLEDLLNYWRDYYRTNKLNGK